MTAAGDTYLIDWDTAALALPERDLWLLHDHVNAAIVDLYAARTGRSVDSDALSFYRLRWRIEELIGAVQDGEPAALEVGLSAALSAVAND
jgi:spectinomycin phosphotransferase